MFEREYLDDSLLQLRKLKTQADKAIAQIGRDRIFTVLDPEANSIAVIMKHMAGNMRSRWTDFLTTDGEKPDRDRDNEFVVGPQDTYERIMAMWEDGWNCLFQAVAALGPDDLTKTVRIRGEAHSVIQALNRQLTHYAAHVGQIVLLAKHDAGSSWRTLTIPRRKSKGFGKALLLALAVGLLSSLPARAQEAGQLGVTLAYPAAIGVIWHATERLAIRPDFSFSASTNDALANSNSVVNVGVSGLLYVRRWDDLRAYVSPRFGYERISTSVSSGATAAPTTNAYSGMGSFGVQYRLNQRFSIFGETGLSYNHTSTTSTSVITGTPNVSTSHSWSTKAGVGMIFYF